MSNAWTTWASWSRILQPRRRSSSSSDSSCHGRLEPAKFHAPSGGGGDRHAAANTPGIRHVAFTVNDRGIIVELAEQIG